MGEATNLIPNERIAALDSRARATSDGPLILATGTRTVSVDVREQIHAGQGYRMVLRSEECIASESESDMARSARQVLTLREARIESGAIAHIGGGFCVTARLLGSAYTHDIYEIEPALERYATGFRFVPGDWSTTLPVQGLLYDAIIYDLGGEVPVSNLTQYLADGGIIVTGD